MYYQVSHNWKCKQNESLRATDAKTNCISNVIKIDFSCGDWDVSRLDYSGHLQQIGSEGPSPGGARGVEAHHTSVNKV